jgi:DNA-binding FadR family transcriptional regulator
MGLVTINNGERARVTEPTVQNLVGELSGAVRHLLSRPDGVSQFQQARVMFEVALVRHAATHATQAQIVTLKALLDTNKAAIGQERAFEHTDVAFHYGLAEIPGNPIFTALHAAIADWLVEQRTISIRARGSDRAAFRAHKRICECVAAHDVDGAEEAMRHHLAEVEEFYWQVRGR